jgi:hypothetical protein
MTMKEIIPMIERLIAGMMYWGNRVVFAGIAAFMLLAPIAPVSAGETPDRKSGWEYRVAPYMWLHCADGDATVKGQKSDVDVEFSDIWDELNFAVLLTFDARKGNWGFLGDVMYANLGKERSGSGISIEPDLQALILNLGVFYRLGTWGLSDAPTKRTPTVTVDALLGGRYTSLDLELDIGGKLPDPEGDQDWVDPLVGIRTLWLTERWTFSLEGSVGGFSVGSDMAWHAQGLIGYRFSLFGKRDARFVGGYRALYMDYEDGSGADKFEWDVTLHGPILGLVIHL